MLNSANNPTFTRNNTGGTSAGYYTRTFFVWSPYEEWNNLAGTDWTNDVSFDGINSSLIASKPEYCHGTNVLPAEYWRVGKQIRATGTAYVSGSGQLFNMRFGLYSAADASTVWVAIENKSTNHYFFNNSAGEALVDFQCMLIIKNSAQMVGQGYYQYNRNANTGTNSNRSNSYVPLWINGAESINSTSTTNILFNFYGSTVTTIRLQNLRLEELA